MESIDIVNQVFRGKVSLIHRPALAHLCDMAKLAPPGIAVEIGVFKGSSLSAIGMARAGMGKVIGIDDWSYTKVQEGENLYDITIRMLERFEVDADLYSMTSEEAAKLIDGPLAFVHIDGNHTYDFVKQDIELWTPKIMSGGICAFHDYGRARADIQVKQAVDEWQMVASWENLGENLTTIGFRKP